MTTLEIPPGACWSDRFARPDPESLLTEMGEELLEPFQIIRDALRDRGLLEDLAWHGPSYRWALAYQTKGSDKPLFYLVPRPGSPMLAAPVEVQRLAEIQTGKLDRMVRDRIALASVVGPVAWCSWFITSKTAAAAIVNGVKVIWGDPA